MRPKRQRGSHLRLEMTNERGRWVETVPSHQEIARGTLGSIVRRMSAATGVEYEVLVDELSARNTSLNNTDRDGTTDEFKGYIEAAGQVRRPACGGRDRE